VITKLASEHLPAGLVLRSPFIDLPAAGAEYYPLLPVRLLARDRFPVAALVPRVATPTVIVYGTADSIIPAAQSRTVAEHAAGPVRVVAVEGADHNDVALAAGPPLIAAVCDLAEQIT
jgi:pimeloyl-ACP methyl ester carboxylesterase